jgi:hypothetical protein
MMLECIAGFDICVVLECIAGFDICVVLECINNMNRSTLILEKYTDFGEINFGCVMRLIWDRENYVITLL